MPVGRVPIGHQQHVGGCLASTPAKRQSRRNKLVTYAKRQPAAPVQQAEPLFKRVFDVSVPLAADPGKDDFTVSDALCKALAKKLGCKGSITTAEVQIVRKSFDARKDKKFVYVVDISDAAIRAAGVRNPARHPQLQDRPPQACEAPPDRHAARPPGGSKSAALTDPVVVVGSGPAGLFAALKLAQAGLPVVLLERGQPVEIRGRDIGALAVRSRLNPDSNLCYGEGGAGTWSDGKLTTRIGRNDTPVRQVLQTLCEFGAPQSILVDGKPHLGTDRLVRILKAFRARLTELGVQIRWGTCISGVDVQDGTAVGVRLQDGGYLKAAKVLLATGHSSRALLQDLFASGVKVLPKPFAMGFRIEHPQALIDELQYGAADAAAVLRGSGPVPVADYRLTAKASKGLSAERSIFSFCMCPGGQVVPTSVQEDELCVNGMSFSKRNSKFANSAIVVGVDHRDWEPYTAQHGVLAGIALQREAERAAAVMGGGKLVCPVQRVTDFMAGITSDDGVLPASSYRLGVKAAPLHHIYSPEITSALRQALKSFDRQLPGFISDQGLLHGVETRTSCPVQIERGADFQSVSTAGLFPVGEGAGYAGGIVSAAVDGLKVGRYVATQSR